MKKIKLTNGMTTMVDNEDFEKLSKYSWTISRGYVIRSLYHIKKGSAMRMHRDIMGNKGEVDHINGNKLDNRRTNLRLVTHHQNLFNRPVRKDSKTGVKGVRRVGNAFTARIKFNGKEKHIGTFFSIIEAAKAYDEEATQMFGEYARLNGDIK